MNETGFSTVSSLFVNCSYPKRTDVLAASDTCQLPADSAVVMEDGALMYRCVSHRGKRSKSETGPVRWEVPR